MKLDAVSRAISAAATRLGTSVSARAASMGLGVAVSPIKLAYELGMFVMRMNRTETAIVEDGAGALSQLFVAFFKTQTDSAQLADELALDLHKALIDEAGLTDVQVMGFFKTVSDTASLSDDLTKKVGRSLEDASLVLEASVKDFGKALTDFAGISEAEVMAFFKALTDDAAVTDSAHLLSIKRLNDSASFEDSAYRLISKSITDQLMVTDDWDGAASIDDDQTMQFEKQISDLFGVIDLFSLSIGFVRQFDDAASLNDSIKNSTGKALDDTGALLDNDIRFDNTKDLIDISGVEDELAKELALAPFTDSFAVTDISSLGMGAVKTDTASFTDMGSLRSQGYSDFSYFEEDYVGASRSF